MSDESDIERRIELKFHSGNQYRTTEVRLTLNEWLALRDQLHYARQDRDSALARLAGMETA